jgi:hypothetical protein
MLNIEEKVSLFKEKLLLKNGSYSDVMKDEIYFYFFENENSFDFLNRINTEDEIENKINCLLSKMIMHEHEEGLQTIIYEYA